MSIVVTVNKNKSGEGFLIAPSGNKTFPVAVGLHTSDGSHVNATLKVLPGGAGASLSQTQVAVTGTETQVQLHATSASHARNDTLLQVSVGASVAATFKLTALTEPHIVFAGRFQARFATDGDFYNEKRGTSAGWNFALEGEPDFVPVDNVASAIDKPVGRVVHFNNPPVPVRTHVPPIGVTVSSIVGKAGASTQKFTVGDSIIGLPVNLGPNTYLAANEPQNPTDPPAAESYNPGLEPMAIFEFHLGSVLSGKPNTAQDRPFATGLFGLTAAEIAQYNVIPLATFNSTRKAALLADYNALPVAARTGTPQGRNLSKRIAHLGGNPQASIAALAGTLPFGYSGKESYTGLVNKSIITNPASSSVVSYFANFHSYVFVVKLFNYHSDEQCGQVDGTLTVQPMTQNLTLQPLLRTPPSDSGPQLPR